MHEDKATAGTIRRRRTHSPYNCPRERRGAAIPGVDDVGKEQRGLVRPINFGLNYGVGADSLARKARVEYGVPTVAPTAVTAQRRCFPAGTTANTPP